MTLLPSPDKELRAHIAEDSSAAKALKLLASPRFAKRPVALPDEVQQRISALRNNWGDR